MYQEILDFWFSTEVTALWFKSTPEFDRLLSERYQDVWSQASRGELDHWSETGEGCVALVIVLDQFPLNMFRGQAKSFSSEAQSIEIVRKAIQQGLDVGLRDEYRSFLYMPFMHSENIDDQEKSVSLLSAPGLDGHLRFAQHHRSIVERFGRFPHRNKILGRESRVEEIEYLNSKEAFTG
ncbi:MAG: hypothetical protein ACI9LO_000064 [Planctomycetota bacterium]|jgi:uncharacterized protein (DUF924 family)